MIRLICPKCSEPFEVPDSLAGRTEACPKCGLVCQVQDSGHLLAQPAERPMFAVQPEPPAERPTTGWTVLVLFGLNTVGIVLIITAFITWAHLLGRGPEVPAWSAAVIPVAMLCAGLTLLGLGELLRLVGRIADRPSPEARAAP